MKNEEEEKIETWPYSQDDVRCDMTEEEAKFYTEQYALLIDKVKELYKQGDSPQMHLFAREIGALECSEKVKLTIGLVLGRTIGRIMSDPLAMLLNALIKKE